MSSRKIVHSALYIVVTIEWNISYRVYLFGVFVFINNFYQFLLKDYNNQQELLFLVEFL